MALIAFGIACFPGSTSRAHCAMLAYSAMATLYLLCIALTGHWTGKLLWPAVAAHGLLTLVLALAWPKSRRPHPTTPAAH